MPKPKAAILKKTCARCTEPFEVPDKANYREKKYCTRACSNAATATKRAEAVRSAGRYQAPICPCGKEVPPPPGANYIYAAQKKYCSAECRMEHGAKRQKDPSKWVTFDCQNCGEKVTRYKNYGNGHLKYCSNACAQKHTRKKRHIVVDDAVVLDSGYEAFFWGLCQLLKVPVERFDRDHGVEWREGCWYAPDFYLPTLNMAVELKGIQDDEDLLRFEVFRRESGALTVLGQERLLEMAPWRETFLGNFQP